ncbi:hypothetical protein MCOR27_011291 [Pyricularia oryzae]|nr:hypothetical protein MCOR02_009632 [Pyricularia oryzae]KAI6265736.1 hypothetical protein MCOR27_011291 [Pyricularia oryzae]KAI6267037.1 hypothetical protein MCOR26_009909 [Pyricularia oryzae]KAI6279532.1 hypothetical protein MCOR34_011217 [Pyricularia oryzae]KAI6305852.1 hypothetical protein MCOR29_010334 [Pyricularia oryzae]
MANNSARSEVWCARISLAFFHRGCIHKPPIHSRWRMRAALRKPRDRDSSSCSAVVTSPSQGSRAREPWPGESPIALQAQGRGWGQASPRRDCFWKEGGKDKTAQTNSHHKKQRASISCKSQNESDRVDKSKSNSLEMPPARWEIPLPPDLTYLIFYAVLLFFPTMEGAAQQKTDAPVDHGGKLCSRSNQSSVGHPVLGSVTRELYVPAH